MLRTFFQVYSKALLSKCWVAYPAALFLFICSHIQI